MGLRNRIAYEGLSSFDTSTLTANYQVVNSSGFSHPVLLLKVVNTSTNDVTISFDGVNDHDIVIGSANGRPRTVLNLSFMCTPAPTGYLYMAQGTKVYVKGTASAGSIYVSAYSQGEN